ncbi:MAG TPA: hypothetical protein PKH33_09380 [bacterium]|nr:hypothetical protein [bacterium]
MGNAGVSGGPGQAKSIVEGTLYEFQKAKAEAAAPLKIPDARIAFALGSGIDLTI